VSEESQERPGWKIGLVQPMTETTGPKRVRRPNQRFMTGESEEDGDVSPGNWKRMGGDDGTVPGKEQGEQQGNDGPVFSFQCVGCLKY
jgi:hypothetical protein